MDGIRGVLQRGQPFGQLVSLAILLLQAPADGRVLLFLDPQLIRQLFDLCLLVR